MASPPETRTIVSPVHPGRLVQVASETRSEAGSIDYYFAIESDAVLLSLWVGSVAGDLDVSLSTLTDIGKEFPLTSFPTVSAPTSNLLLKKGANVMSKVKVHVEFTAAVSYEIYARGVSAAEASVRILGASAARASQHTISAVPTLVIASAIVDRKGLILLNNNGLGGEIIYLGYSAAEAVPAIGYPVPAQASLGIDVDSGVEVWAASVSAAADIRIMESGS